MYLQTSCSDKRGGDTPTIVGEFSLSPAIPVQFSATFALSQIDWYTKWFGAQIMAYEKQKGWISWSWKADKIGGIMDWRWSYQGQHGFRLAETTRCEALSLTSVDSCCGCWRHPERSGCCDPGESLCLRSRGGVILEDSTHDLVDSPRSVDTVQILYTIYIRYSGYFCHMQN